MRPQTEENWFEIYECSDCSERTVSPVTRVCEDCGGGLRRAGVA